jgi:hypothetical protein
MIEAYLQNSSYSAGTFANQSIHLLLLLLLILLLILLKICLGFCGICNLTNYIPILFLVNNSVLALLCKVIFQISVHKLLRNTYIYCGTVMVGWQSHVLEDL